MVKLACTCTILRRHERFKIMNAAIISTNR